jgi:hypothetical protein
MKKMMKSTPQPFSRLGGGRTWETHHRDFFLTGSLSFEKNQGSFRKFYREKITYSQKIFFLISGIIFSKKIFFFLNLRA